MVGSEKKYLMRQRRKVMRKRRSSKRYQIIRRRDQSIIRSFDFFIQARMFIGCLDHYENLMIFDSHDNHNIWYGHDYHELEQKVDWLNEGF